MVLVIFFVAECMLMDVVFLQAIQHWPLHEFGKNTTQQTQHNLKIFEQAWQRLDDVRTPRCCGC